MKKVILGFLLLFWAMPCTGRTIILEADGSGDYPTIQAAIDDSNDGDIIEVQPGTYRGNGNRDLDYKGKAITIRSTDPNDTNTVAATIIDCENSGRGFHFHSEETTSSILAGLTIRSGKAPQESAASGFWHSSGGAILCDGSSPTITKCVIEESSATCHAWGHWGFALGGGICCVRSNTVITHCTITDNSVSGDWAWGGGICCGGGGAPTISHCTVTGNKTFGELQCQGGGIRTSADGCAIRACEAFGNSAKDGGGVCCASRGTTTITDSAILNNTARGETGTSETGTSPAAKGGVGRGGGVYWGEEASGTIKNCTIYNNVARGGLGGAPIPEGMGGDGGNGYGGAIFCKQDGEVRIGSCIISGNSAVGGPGGGMGMPAWWPPVTPGDGGDGYGGALCAETSEVTIANCAIVGNTANPGRGRFAGSAATGGFYCPEASPVITNCIFAQNRRGQISPSAFASYSCFDSVGITGTGNITADPCFAWSGYWNPNESPQHIDDDFWADGDYHLKSHAGRWEPNTQNWVQDGLTSPCIDAGNPQDPIGPEPFPNGGIVNMGVYGGAGEASKSYFGGAVCETIVAGDIDGDCKVDFRDVGLMVLHWLEQR